MHLVAIGVNHKTASVDLRERLSIPKEKRAEVLLDFRAAGASESLVLSTCNRTEVYACTPTRAYDARIIQSIAKFSSLSLFVLEAHIYSYAGHKAVEHIFKVTSGIDSMVIGEDQILGQVKEAYEAARQFGFTGTVLNALFQQALTVGKRARTETEISRGAFSIGSAAAQLAKSIFENLEGRTILIIGAGKMGELAVTHLASCGVGAVLVSNRTREKAVSLASRFHGVAVPFEELESILPRADIVITSTGAGETILRADIVSQAMRVRRGRPMFFIDIAVPRDVASDVRFIDNVFVYSIDDLEAIVESDRMSRQLEVAKVEVIIAEEVKSFMRWFRALEAVPVVTALREKVECIRVAELQKLKKKLPGLSLEEIEAVEAATRSIVNRICHQPMIRIKEYAASEDTSEKLEIACDLFGISSGRGGDQGDT